MPVSIAKMIIGNPELVVASREDSIGKALELMLEYDFSQLPVVDDDFCPLGMVTYKNILQAIRNLDSSMDEILVRFAVTKAPKHFLDEDLFDVLEELKRANAVLIVDREEKLVGIVTSFDSTEFLRSQAENLMRVEDIENLIKEIIQLAYIDSNGELDEPKLANSIATVLDGGTVDSRQSHSKSFDDLSLGEYIRVLSHNDTWKIAGPILEMERKPAISFLHKIRLTRNDLAHFRNELSVEQSEQLKKCSDWLSTCLESYQASQGFDVTQEFLTPPVHEVKILRDSGLDYSMGSQENTTAHGSTIFVEESRPRESRYSPLADYLVSIPGDRDRVKLSFGNVEVIINGELPKSAYTHRAWWANDSIDHPHSKLWLDAGWRTSYINMSQESVVFARIREKERAYIGFFNELIGQLKKEADFSIRDYSPNGNSWFVFQVIDSPGTIVGQFAFSFVRNGRFRVELYLDTQEKQSTKLLFDAIQKNHDRYGSQLRGIEWERINDKRGARIAVYTDGEINAHEKDLNALRSWAVDTMIHFYHVFEHEVSRIAKELLGPKEG